MQNTRLESRGVYEYVKTKRRRIEFFPLGMNSVCALYSNRGKDGKAR